MMQQITRLLILKTGLHVLIWTVLMVFPFLLLPRQFDGTRATDLAHVWVPVMEYGIIFYLNYFILADRFVFKQKRYLIFLLINIAMILLFRFDGAFINLFEQKDQIYRLGKVGKVSLDHKDANFMFKNVIALFVPTIFSVAVKAIENWSKLERRNRETENRNLKNELQNLKYQLQPHFFFNSLNNIYALVDISPEKAQEAIHGLSKLMRYLLYEASREKITVREEISFLEKYIQLMEIRQGGNTKTIYDFPSGIDPKLEIAPLLFVPLVENSYKHGISAKEPSRLSFTFEVNGNEVIFKAWNTNYPKNEKDKSGSGIGMENLSKRLELIYPDKYEFWHELVDDIFYVDLRINLEE